MLRNASPFNYMLVVALVVLFCAVEFAEAAKCPCQATIPGTTVTKREDPHPGGKVKVQCTNESEFGNFVYTWCYNDTTKPGIPYGQCIFKGGKNEHYEVNNEDGTLCYMVQRNIDCGTDDGLAWDVVDHYVCVADGSTIRGCWNWDGSKWVETWSERRYNTMQDYKELSMDDANRDGIPDSHIEFLYDGLYDEVPPDLGSIHEARLDLEPTIDSTSTIGNGQEDGGPVVAVNWQAENMDVEYDAGDYILFQGLPASAVLEYDPGFELRENREKNRIELVARGAYKPQHGSLLLKIKQDAHVPATLYYASVDLGAIEYFGEFFTSRGVSMQDIGGGFMNTSTKHWQDFPGSIGMSGYLHLGRFGGFPYAPIGDAGITHLKSGLHLGHLGNTEEAIGLEFELFRASGFDADFVPFVLNAGAEFSASIKGLVGRRHIPLASATVLAAGSGMSQLGLEFEERLKAANLHVELLDAEGRRIHERTQAWNSPIGIMGTVTVAGARWSGSDKESEGYLQYSLRFGQTVTVELGGSTFGEVARIRVQTADAAVLPSFIEQISFHALGVEGYVVEDVRIQYRDGGAFVKGAGFVHLKPYKPEIELSNLDKTAKNGIAVDIGNASYARIGFGFMIDEQPMYGDAIRVEARGATPGNPDDLIAAVSAQIGDYGTQLHAAFDAIGSDMCDVAVYNSTELVSVARDVSGALADIAIERYGFDGEWSAVSVSCNEQGIPSINIEFNTVQDIRLAGSSAVVNGNLIVLSPVGAQNAVESMRTLRVLGKGYPAFHLTEIYTSETPVTGVTTPYEQALSTQSFRFNPVHPNPFGLQAALSFELFEDARVDLALYDRAGRRMATLVQGDLNTGSHSATWNAATNNAVDGIYFARLEVRPRGSDATVVRTQELILQR